MKTVLGWIFAAGNFLDSHNGAIVALATLAIAIFTIFLYLISRRQISATRVIERAYVKMSHLPPGFRDIAGLMQIILEVKNYGNTPAQVTDVLIKPIMLSGGDKLPAVPDYRRSDMMENIPKAFLVPDESFLFYPDPLVLGPMDTKAIRNGTKIIYFIGYVDYIDQFGQRHRAGYGRQYRADIDNATYQTPVAYERRNNLIVIAQSHYNYDRPRKKGEGQDWDKEPN